MVQSAAEAVVPYITFRRRIDAGTLEGNFWSMTRVLDIEMFSYCRPNETKMSSLSMSAAVRRANIGSSHDRTPVPRTVILCSRTCSPTRKIMYIVDINV